MQFAHSEYSRGHMTRITAVDALIFLIGLALLVGPFVMGMYPGDLDVTAHVTVGALIAILAIFRVLVAYGSLWIEVPIFFLGLIALRFPAIMHMEWNSQYSTGHLVAGGLVMALSILSALLTLPVMKKPA